MRGYTLISIFAGALLLTVAQPVAAQHEHEQQAVVDEHAGGDQDGMMKGMMSAVKMTMEGMMSSMKEAMDDPFLRSRLTVTLLPTMQEALALSPEQIDNLQLIKGRFNQEQSALTDQAQRLHDESLALANAEVHDRTEITQILRETAMVGADMKALALATSDEMLSTLAPEQRKRLAAMTPMQVHHHMMMNLSMMEMMRAMSGTINH